MIADLAGRSILPHAYPPVSFRLMRRHSPLPSLDALLRQPAGSVLVERFGRAATVAGLRAALAERRAGPRLADGLPDPVGTDTILDAAADALAARFAPSQRPVFNLTGTVLHTNLGRAPLPPEAAAAAAEAMASPTTLEFDLATGVGTPKLTQLNTGLFSAVSTTP